MDYSDEPVLSFFFGSSFEEPNDRGKSKVPIIKDEPLTWKFWKKRRYVVVMMAFLGFFNVYALRVNLSVAIVAMTEKREDAFGNIYQEFSWSSEAKGWVLSSFFYGYLFTQLVGVYVAGKKRFKKIGGHLLFAIGIGLTSILTLLTPLAAHYSFAMLLTVRIIEGMFEGVAFTCIHAVWSKWAPLPERSRMSSIAFSGSYVGTVVAMMFSGVFAQKYGWESPFYTFGSIGVIWSILWLIFVRKSPKQDPYISENELAYIQSKLVSKSNKKKTTKQSWKDVLTSAAFYGIAIIHFSENWGFYTLFTHLPTYLKDILKFNLEKAGFISAVPYFCMGMLLFVSGYLADWLQVKKILSAIQVRKCFNGGAFFAQCAFMVMAGFIENPAWNVICITSSIGLGAFAWSGFAVNSLSLDPENSGLMIALGNIFATIPGIVSPILTGHMVTQEIFKEWSNVFFVTAGIYFFGFFVHLF